MLGRGFNINQRVIRLLAFLFHPILCKSYSLHSKCQNIEAELLHCKKYLPEVVSPQMSLIYGIHKINLRNLQQTRDILSLLYGSNLNVRPASSVIKELKIHNSLKMGMVHLKSRHITGAH